MYLAKAWYQVVSRLQHMARLDRTTRFAIVLLIDTLVCVLSSIVAYWLRLGELPAFDTSFFKFVPLALITWLVAGGINGTYQSILRHAGSQTIINLARAASLQAVLLSVLLLALRIPNVPRTLAVIQPMVAFALAVAIRLAVRFLLKDTVGIGDSVRKRRIAIYGAGESARRLAAAIENHPELRLMAYFSSDTALIGRRLEGARVYSPASIDDVIDRYKIDEVMLAIPGAPKAQRKQIVTSLAQQHVRVSSLPDLGQILTGSVTLADVHQVDVVELLGRDPVQPNRQLMGGILADRCVLITGAGGSIGSELAQQILRFSPRRIVLADISEFALFSIDQTLREIVAESPSPGLASVEIVPELVDCRNSAVMARMFERYRPHTVFHAAAYKHVPLLEQNPVVGAGNNIFGTLVTAQMAERFGTERFIQVSTDKAVRPTSVMGTTKRICELILQALQLRGSTTVFSMVRFGNVLGSSGSVVPTFRKQIAVGGPVTVTDLQMTRYFMTIPEAAQLVIQAGAMAKGGEVFLLDMGEPVRIADLAETMIRLHGKTVRSPAFPSGDIEILEVGLRPGEKLYEELLIDSTAEPTDHPGIFQAMEHAIAWIEVEQVLIKLRNAVDAGDGQAVRSLLNELVPEAIKPETGNEGAIQTDETVDSTVVRKALP